MALWHLFLGSFEPNNTLMQNEGTVDNGAGGIQLTENDCNF